MDNVPRADFLPSHLQIPETVIQVHSSHGVDLMVTDWGRPHDERPVLFMSHATGMHGHAWLPMVVALGERFRCIAIDQRAQGESSRPTVGDLQWNGVADDVEIAMGSLGLMARPDVYGLGHSQGGFAALEVERRRPGTFAGLFLYEPIVFPNTNLAERRETDKMMASFTIRRRRTFDSSEAAFRNFQGKGAFATIDDDVLRSYVHWGFTELEDGSVTLKCDPTDEAAFYLLSVTDVFDHAERIMCATTVALGTATNPAFAAGPTLLAESLPHGRLVTLEGRSHFGVFEGVAEMAELIVMSLLGERVGTP
jgi:pimeloyl-ACP methyl ester carboxylesterase